MSARQVYVVEDEEAIRRSMHLMLRVLGYEPQAFESGVMFLDAAPTLDKGAVLLDLRMPEVDGLEVQRRLTKAGSDHSIIVMSGHGDLAVAVTAMEQGAIAFLEKPFPRAMLEQGLETAFLRLEDAEGYRQYVESTALAVARLDSVDRTVLQLMARGQDTESIAREMGLPTLSIEVSRSRIFADLGTDSLTEVLRVAFAAAEAAAS